MDTESYEAGNPKGSDSFGFTKLQQLVEMFGEQIARAEQVLAPVLCQPTTDTAPQLAMPTETAMDSTLADLNNARMRLASILDRVKL